jgi:hypothetical protein
MMGKGHQGQKKRKTYTHSTHTYITHTHTIHKRKKGREGKKTD